jgi:hypothetical protein
MNRMIFTRFTGTPMLRDASFDPQTAKIQFPNRPATCGGDGDDADPPQELDLEVSTSDREQHGVEQLGERVVRGGRTDPADDRLAVGDQSRHGEARAPEHVQGAEGHDERREAGPDHDVAIERPDGQGEAEGEDEPEPQRQAVLGDREAEDQAGGTDHRADGQVELAGDHQQGHGGTEDADLGGHLDVGGEAPPGHEARADGEAGQGPEHEEDEIARRSTRTRAVSSWRTAWRGAAA